MILCATHIEKSSIFVSSYSATHIEMSLFAFAFIVLGQALAYEFKSLAEIERLGRQTESGTT